MTGFIPEISAILNSGKFVPFVKGVHLQLPDGSTVQVKIRSTRRSVRPVGLRFSKHAFVTEVEAGTVVGTGYGEDQSRLIAVQKSIAEGVERAIYRALKGTPFGSATSNGWAAHLSRAAAQRSALEELLERDAILVHWLCQRPMWEITLSSGPRWLRRWVTRELPLSPEYRSLRILVSDQGHLPTVTTILLNDRGNAVLSHATASTLEDATRKALAETCRIAQIALERRFFDSSLQLASWNEALNVRTSPEDHVMLYAYHRELPGWIFGRVEEWTSAQSRWSDHSSLFSEALVDPVFQQAAGGPLVVGHCTSKQVQNLYFGRTEQAGARGLLNVRRLRAVKAEGEFNLLPHCIA